MDILKAHYQLHGKQHTKRDYYHRDMSLWLLRDGVEKKHSWTLYNVGRKSKTLTKSCSNANPFSAGIDFRRQILTFKVDPRTERIKTFMMAVYPWHRYSNKAGKANSAIYWKWKLKTNPFVFRVIYKYVSALRTKTCKSSCIHGWGIRTFSDPGKVKIQ